MIQCHFFTSERSVVGFAIAGHDTPDNSGVSVLCAAVSSAAYLTANAVTEIGGVKPLVLETGDGLMTMRLSRNDAKTCALLLEGLRLHLEALAADHPSIITVKITEV